MHKAKDEELLQEAKKNVSQCDRCGTCLPVCPLFEVKDVETSGARGKNAIARALAEGGIEPAPDVLAAVNFCLLCRACVETCPTRTLTFGDLADEGSPVAQLVARLRLPRDAPRAGER